MGAGGHISRCHGALAVVRMMGMMGVMGMMVVGGCTGNLGSAGGNFGGGPAPGPGAMPPAGMPPSSEAGCRIDLMPASPLSFDGLSAGPDTKLKVRGVVTGLPPTDYDWEWNVSLANGGSVPFTQPSPEDALIQFSLPEPGTYTVAARLVQSRLLCVGERTVIVARTNARLRSFRFRAIPPAESDLPMQDIVIQVFGGTPSGGNRLPLARGIQVPLEVREASTGASLRAYVRITDDTGIVFEGQSGRSARPLVANLPSGMYETLVVPEGDLAPLRLPAMPVTDLARMTIFALSLDSGVAVDGVVQDADGSPLPNSKVILRAGTLASTLGVTDGEGAFRVRVRPGQFAGTVSPPVALGMLRAEFPVAAGITISADAGPAPKLAFKLRPFRTARLALALTGAPSSLGAEARVIIESMTPIADVATLSVGQSIHALAARIHGELIPNADGMVLASTLPRGRYKATIFPAGDADAVTTVTDIEVDGADVNPRPVTLARKVNLRGTLLPGGAAAGVQVVALDVDSLVPLAFVKQVVAGGGWEMAVNPARTYTLRALPLPGQRFARASFGRVSVASSDLSVAAHNMPDGLLYSGTVVDPALQGVQGVLLQMFCLAGTPDCADPTIPVAETLSASVGSFQMMLPDPGVTP